MALLPVSSNVHPLPKFLLSKQPSCQVGKREGDGTELQARYTENTKMNASSHDESKLHNSYKAFVVAGIIAFTTIFLRPNFL